MSALIEELQNIVQNYPVWPGDTLSHKTAAECAQRGWAVRQADGCWVPTSKGLVEYRKQEVKS